MIGADEDSIGEAPEEWLSRLHPDDAARVRAKIAAHLEGRTPRFEDEHRLRHRDGTCRWFLSRGFAVRAADGKAYRMAGAQTETTDRRSYDALTGLPNRALFVERVAEALDRASRRRALVLRRALHRPRPLQGRERRPRPRRRRPPPHRGRAPAGGLGAARRHRGPPGRRRVRGAGRAHGGGGGRDRRGRAHPARDDAARADGPGRGAAGGQHRHRPQPLRLRGRGGAAARRRRRDVPGQGGRPRALGGLRPGDARPRWPRASSCRTTCAGPRAAASSASTTTPWWTCHSRRARRVRGLAALAGPDHPRGRPVDGRGGGLDRAHRRRGCCARPASRPRAWNARADRPPVDGQRVGGRRAVPAARARAGDAGPAGGVGAAAAASLLLEVTEETILSRTEGMDSTFAGLEALGVGVSSTASAPATAPLAALRRYPLHAVKLDGPMVASLDGPGRGHQPGAGDRAHGGRARPARGRPRRGVARAGRTRSATPAAPSARARSSPRRSTPNPREALLAGARSWRSPVSRRAG